VYWFVQHFFPGQYLLFVAIAGAFGFVFREILWEMIGRAWLLGQRWLGLAKDERATAPAIRETTLAERNSVGAGLRAIRERDPSFDAAAFLAQVQQVCAAVGKGWADKNLESCRALMADACWLTQKGILDRGFLDGWRAAAGTITFADGQIVLAAIAANADRITVRVRIACPAGTGKLVRGRRISDWEEDWTFARSIALGLPAGARTPVAVQRGAWLLERMDHVAIHLEKAEHAAA